MWSLISPKPALPKTAETELFTPKEKTTSIVLLKIPFDVR